MKKIKKYAFLLQLFSIIIVIPFMSYMFIKNLISWFQGPLPIKILLLFPVLTRNVSPATKAFGIILDLIPFLLFFLGMFYFIRILNYLKKNLLFTSNVFFLFKRLTYIALFWVIYHPISYTLLGLVVTLNNPKGYRYLSFVFTYSDALNILLFGLFLIITSLMHEGLKLKEEQDLTV